MTWFTNKKVVSFLISLILLLTFQNCSKKPTSSEINNINKKTTLSKSSDRTTKTTTTDKITAGSTTKSKSPDSAANGIDVSDGENDNLNGENVEPNEAFEEENAIDFKGATIVWAAWYVSPQLGISTSGDLGYKYFTEAKERYNCKVEWKQIPYANYHNAMASEMLAGLKFADICMSLSHLVYPNLAKSGFFTALEDYVDNSKGWWNLPLGMWSGHLYGLGSVDGTLGYATIYNSDIIERAGMRDISNLAREGGWNWDALLEYAVNTNLDFNGDGMIDQIAIGGTHIPLAVLYSNGVNPIEFKDNKFVSGFDQASAIRALQFSHDLVYIYKVVDMGGYTSLPLTKEKFQKGFMAMYFQPAGEAQKDKTAGSKFVRVAPLPMGPDVNAYQNINTNSLLCHIPSLKSHATGDLLKFYIEATAIWDPDKEDYIDIKVAKTMDYKERFTTSDENGEYMGQLGFSNPLKVAYLANITELQSAIYSNILNPVLISRVSVSQALESSSPKIHEIIDRNLNN